MGTRIVVLGGGIGGLSAAHELIERGFEVELYEADTALGGKARSQPVERSGTHGRRDLPGEHGFRFFPRFYRHLIDTMQRTPLAHDTSKSTASNLLATDEAAIAPENLPGLYRFYRRAPRTVFGVVDAIELFFADMQVDPADVSLFSLKVLEYFTSCQERRLRQYEPMAWWDYLEGDRYSQDFQRYLGAVPRTMVAMDPHVGSARTIGDVSMQLLLDFAAQGVNTDRTLNGPTSEAWLDHWEAYLRGAGVAIHLDAPVEGFELAGGRIAGVRIRGVPEPVTGDYYVAALPVEAMVPLISPEMADSAPSLAKLAAVDLGWLTSWMSGAQFFLYEDVPTVAGHVFYPDSPWALTSISQAQFWRERGLFRRVYGNGEVGGVLSVDISQWKVAGEHIDKPARLCTPDEIQRELWWQLKAALNGGPKPLLTDDNLHSVHIDENILFAAHGSSPPVRNRTPLLVHPPGAWSVRPEAGTAIDNLVLAADYVRTYTNLASMEGANEAARRAINIILTREGYGGRHAGVWPLEEPPEFDRAKRLDRALLAAGKPHLFEMMHVDSVFAAAQLMRRATHALGLGRAGKLIYRYQPTRLIESGLRWLGWRGPA